MQKQLITHQLIEEYQKELKRVRRDLEIFPESRVLSRAENIIEGFIERLQSLRQQEVQNVIDAMEAGIKDVEQPVIKRLMNGNNYFTQTFEQKGGGQK